MLECFEGSYRSLFSCGTHDNPQIEWHRLYRRGRSVTLVNDPKIDIDAGDRDRADPDYRQLPPEIVIGQGYPTLLTHTDMMGLPLAGERVDLG